MKAKTVGGMPRPSRPSNAIHDWPALVEVLKENPGEPVLTEAFTQTEKAESIRTSLTRTLPAPIRALGGTITCNIRNSTVVRKSPRRLVGDVWVTWTPPKEG